MPIISQCPVTESFPIDASAMRPIAPAGALCADEPADIDDAIESKAAEYRDAKPDLPRDVAERVAAFIAVHGSVRQSACADTVEHDDDDSGKGGGHGMLCEQGLDRCQRLAALARTRKPH